MLHLSPVAVAQVGTALKEVLPLVRDVYIHKTALNHERRIKEMDLNYNRWHKELESEIRDSDRAHEAAESAMQRESLLADAREHRAHEIEKMWEHAHASVWYQEEMHTYHARNIMRPFAMPVDDLRNLLDNSSQGGARPLLLFAPFMDELSSAVASEQDPQRYRVGLRNTWATSPWAGDAEPLDGIFSRPLHQTDVDIYLIRQELGNVPVVLVDGRIQARGRLWLTVSGWGMGYGPAGLRIQFPPLDLPLQSDLDGPNGKRVQLEFEDEIGARFAPVAALLFDWFHLVRHGRKPQLHITLPKELPGVEITSIAASSIEGFWVAERNGVLNRIEALSGAARVATEANLRPAIGELVADLREAVATDLASVSDRTVGSLAALAASTRAAGDVESTAATYQLIAEATQFLLNELSGGGL